MYISSDEDERNRSNSKSRGVKPKRHAVIDVDAVVIDVDADTEESEEGVPKAPLKAGKSMERDVEVNIEPNTELNEVSVDKSSADELDEDEVVDLSDHAASSDV